MFIIIVLLILITIFLIKKNKDKFKVYTQPITGNSTYPLSELFNFPSCNNGQSGCIGPSPDNLLFNGFRYKTDVGLRCFKSKDNTNNLNRLNSAVNKSLNNIETYFDECYAGSLFDPPLGRFVRLQNNVVGAFDIQQFEAYTRNDNGDYLFVKPIDINVIPFVINTNYSVLLNQNNVTRVSTGTDSVSRPYIQLDLGSNVPITKVIIYNNSTTVVNLTLTVIRDNSTVNGVITYATTINTAINT